MLPSIAAAATRREPRRREIVGDVQSAGQDR
jgi:hypothetical protein